MQYGNHTWTDHALVSLNERVKSTLEQKELAIESLFTCKTPLILSAMTSYPRKLSYYGIGTYYWIGLSHNHSSSLWNDICGVPMVLCLVHYCFQFISMICLIIQSPFFLLVWRWYFNIYCILRLKTLQSYNLKSMKTCWK